jgi:uncharacterized protein YuzE
MELKHLNAKSNGERDYDYANDILFFKVKGKEDDRSIELEDVVLDIDTEGYITGIQILGASKMFNVEKDMLQNVQKWEFKVRTEGKMISIN